MDLAHRQADALGMPDVPIVHITKRLASRTLDELEELVDEALDDMCAALTRPGESG